MSTTTSKEYPAGRYYVGDLCYFEALDWKEFCDKTVSGQACLDGDFIVSGRETWHHGTAYGDGCYGSNLGLEFAVDAGLIGICALRDGERAPKGGHMVVFENPFHCSYVKGTFYIGDLVIYTDDSEWYRDEDEDE